jgi:F-type H+-transporting ATPase subunit b
VQELIRSLNIEWPVVFAQILAVIALFFVLQRFLYRPLAAIMRQREEQVAEHLATAEAQQKKAEGLRAEYEAHLAQIAEEARAKLDAAIKDAEGARQRALAQTQTEVRELHDRGQQQLVLEREQLRRELRSELSDIAVLAASRALRGQITPAIQTAVIDQVIRELDHLPTQPA